MWKIYLLNLKYFFHVSFIFERETVCEWGRGREREEDTESETETWKLYFIAPSQPNPGTVTAGTHVQMETSQGPPGLNRLSLGLLISLKPWSRSLWVQALHGDPCWHVETAWDSLPLLSLCPSSALACALSLSIKINKLKNTKWNRKLPNLRKLKFPSALRHSCQWLS